MLDVFTQKLITEHNQIMTNLTEWLNNKKSEIKVIINEIQKISAEKRTEANQERLNLLYEQIELKQKEFIDLVNKLPPGFKVEMDIAKKQLDVAIAEYRELVRKELAKFDVGLIEMEKFYELEISIMKYFNGSLTISNLEKLANMELVKNYLNANEFSVKLYELIAKSEVFNLFPKPTDNNSGYTKFYNIVSSIRAKSLLAHRFDITGKSKVDEIEFDLHGGYQQVMVPEMAHSFNKFIDDKNHTVVSELMNSEFGEVEEKSLSGLLNTVKEDVKNCVLKEDEQLIVEHADQVLLLAPTIKVKEGFHAISVAFNDELCLISDKARDNPGMDIYKLQGTPEKINNDKIKVSLDFAQRMFVPPNAQIETTEMLSERLVNSLGMKKIDSIALQSQYGHNCTWSSCSKSVLLSALYLRLYNLAKNLNTIKNLSPEQRDAKAAELAKIHSKSIQNQWAHFDKLEFLKKYIEEYSDPNKQDLGPDPELLAYIQLKYTNNVNIVNTIKQTNLVKVEHINKAKRTIFNFVENLMQREIGEELYNAIQSNFPVEVEELITKIGELRLISTKGNTEQVVSQLRFNSEDDLKDGIDYLDVAIAKAKRNNKTKSLTRKNEPRRDESPKPIIKQYKMSNKSQDKKSELDVNNSKTLNKKTL